MGRLNEHLRSKLIAGVLAAIPVAVTAFILWFVDAKTRALFGFHHPFAGVLIALLAIYLLGLFVTSFAGRELLGVVDRVLGRLPGLRDLYRSWKDIALASDGQTGIFARVVLVPDESGAMRMLGFSTGRGIEGDPATCCVFVPASPNPTSGRLYFVPMSSCTFLELSPQAALKLILSGGNHIPAAVGAGTSAAAAAHANAQRG